MNVVHNPYQGGYPRILFICSAGILRSATAAHLFGSTKYKWNTRSAGIDPYALTQVTKELLTWARVIFCMERHHADTIIVRHESELPELHQRIHILNIPDVYSYRDPDLETLLESRIEGLVAEESTLAFLEWNSHS
jgi:predicted protein tyrosine phosphatase